MIIGIDVSTKDVAITMIWEDNLEIYRTHKIELSGLFEEKIEETTTFLRRKIEQASSLGKMYIFVEQPKYQFQNHLSDMLIGAIVGIYRTHNYQNTYLIVPNEWKATIGYPRTARGQKGLSEKQKIAGFEEHYPQTKGLDPDNMDAFGIGLGGAIKHGLIKNGTTNKNNA